MSILIKDMNMPTRCADCPMCYDFISCQLEGKAFGEIDCIEIRADWCPLIELPPHGDLIDRDAVLEILSDKNAAWDGYVKVKALPIVIESEE